MKDLRASLHQPVGILLIEQITYPYHVTCRYSVP